MKRFLEGAAIGALAYLAGFAVGHRPVEVRQPVSAVQARLIGSCGGQVLSGMEEDDFPDGCEWIEPIRMEAD